jgi:DNA-binding protein HU-beta
MSKEELVRSIAEETNYPLQTVNTIVTSALNQITQRVKNNQIVRLVGFGSFRLVERKARQGRNPSTGEKVHIPASQRVKFTAGKNLKV